MTQQALSEEEARMQAKASTSTVKSRHSQTSCQWTSSVPSSPTFSTRRTPPGEGQDAARHHHPHHGRFGQYHTREKPQEDRHPPRPLRQATVCLTQTHPSTPSTPISQRNKTHPSAPQDMGVFFEEVIQKSEGSYKEVIRTIRLYLRAFKDSLGIACGEIMVYRGDWGKISINKNI